MTWKIWLPFAATLLLVICGLLFWNQQKTPSDKISAQCQRLIRQKLYVIYMFIHDHNRLPDTLEEAVVAEGVSPDILRHFIFCPKNKNSVYIYIKPPSTNFLATEKIPLVIESAKNHGNGFFVGLGNGNVFFDHKGIWLKKFFQDNPSSASTNFIYK
jgi:hypothetical protein